MTWVTGSHHVLCVEHLLGEFGNSEGPVLLGSSGSKRSKAGHEEVESGEGNHVDCQLTEIGIELTWEAEAGGDTGHGGGNQVVQVTVCWGGELEGSEQTRLDLGEYETVVPEADVVQGFVVDAVGLVSVLDELMDGEGGVVGLDNSVRDFGGWDDREGVHDSVWVFLTDFRDQKGTHTGTGSTSKRVSQLKALQTLVRLSN